MAYEYQNLFTTVQAHNAGYVGVPVRTAPMERTKAQYHVHWLGKIGDAQVGPIYLGWFGVTSLLCGDVTP